MTMTVLLNNKFDIFENSDPCLLQTHEKDILGTQMIEYKQLLKFFGLLLGAAGDTVPEQAVGTHVIQVLPLDE